MMRGLLPTVMMTTMMMGNVYHCSSEGISEGIIEEGNRLSSFGDRGERTACSPHSLTLCDG